LRQILVILLNRIEQLESKLSTLEAENQKLRDENNQLKGEKGKPKIKPSSKTSQKKHDSETERFEPKKHQKSRRNESIRIDKEQILFVPKEQLPTDAVFKGYETVLVQDINLDTNNILFRKEKYYSPQLGKTFLAEMPVGYEGQFGPNLKALIISLYYGSNLTEGKLQEFLFDIGTSISAGQISNLLIKNQEIFHQEKFEVLHAGLSSSPWQHFDQTNARVKGQNYNCNVICNPLYTAYHTTVKKDRLSVLDVLTCGCEREYVLNTETFELLEIWLPSLKVMQVLRQLPQGIRFTEPGFLELLQKWLPSLGVKHRSRIREAAAIAAYHQSDKYSVITVLVCDDAPQFKLLTSNIALCWVHDARHYKKLRPVLTCHRKQLNKFLKKYWKFYRKLKNYRIQPDPNIAALLREKFRELFSTVTEYFDLNDRIRRTLEKEKELLLVLDHPELPLHNNAAELGARTMVLRRNISYGTQSETGTKAWDTFLSLVATTRKLGISFFKYIRDRVCKYDQIDRLWLTIHSQATILQLGASWDNSSFESVFHDQVA
jgi:hypothetical protein